MPLPRLAETVLRAGALGRIASSCEICRAWSTRRLCEACVDRFGAPAPRCRRCALRSAAALPLCGDCLRDAPPYERTVCADDYAFPWDRLIARFKFEDHPELAIALADRLVQAARASAIELPDAFVAVPSAPLRLAQRGYNPAWEIARRVARALRRPAWPQALQRVLEGDAQSALPRAQRLARLRGAFVVPPAQRPRVNGRHLGLVDDVMTTGATAREVAAVLGAAGATRVDLWVVARTPN